MSNMFSNFGQIFHEGILYYRVEMEGKIYFISSNKEKFELKELKDKGIRFPAFIQNYEAHPYPCLKNMPWSQESIDNFLKAGRSQRIVDSNALFLRVKDIIQKLPHPEDENELLLLSVFPFLSALSSVFKTTPYYLVAGDSYLKKLVLELMEQISFNGIRFNSPNSSLLSRIISLGITPLITIDGDRLGNHSFSNLLVILEEGRQSSGYSHVLNEVSLPIWFPIYSAKMLDVGMGAKYLKNPYIEIQINKQPGDPFYLRLSETEEELQKLRDDLHVCCLEKVNDIFEIYKNIGPDPEISNQWMESLSGTFAILKLLAPLSCDSIETWAKEMTLRFKHNQKFDDKDSHILYLVAEFIQRFGPDTDGYYVAQDISGYINDAGDLSQELRPEDVTRRLKNFHPHRKRDKMVINDEGDKRRRTKIIFDYDKLLKQVDT